VRTRAGAAELQPLLRRRDADVPYACGSLSALCLFPFAFRGYGLVKEKSVKEAYGYPRGASAAIGER